MKNVLAVSLLCVAVVAIGCKKGEKPMAGPKQKPITIELDNSGNIKVKPDSQDVYEDEEAVWNTNPAGEKFHVHFKNGKTPFGSGDFDEGHRQSGAPTVKVTQPTPYAYEVRYKNKVLDPDVIIKPGTR
jgi:hypothetical protein